jgi:parvulin-like peptidyl-prolyl isomerase
VYYEKNKVQFIRTAAEIRLIHFLTTSAEVSVRIVQALNSGKTLEQLVLQYKSEKNIWPNGDLGYFPEVSLPPEIGRVVSRIRKDETSRDIKTEMGFHFIKVLDRQPAGSTKSIEEVRDQIAETLKAEKRNEAYTAFLAKLRSKAESEKFFQINYDALKVFQHDTTNILIQ